MTYKPSKLGQTNLVLVCDQNSSLGMCTHEITTVTVSLSGSGYDFCHPG